MRGLPGGAAARGKGGEGAPEGWAGAAAAGVGRCTRASAGAPRWRASHCPAPLPTAHPALLPLPRPTPSPPLPTPPPRLAAEYREVVERRVYTVTGQHAGGEEIEHLIETGESEMIFQKAILEQGRGYVSDRAGG